VDLASGPLVQFLQGRGKNLLPPAADIDLGSEFEESLGRCLAQARASARNKDALAL
jgi:hypothetical protein